MRTVKQVDETVSVLAKTLCQLQSPLAQHVARLLIDGRHSEVLSIPLDTSSETFRDDYLAIEVLSKYPYLDLHIDREKVAWDKFVEIEDNLVISDNRLFRFEKGWSSEDPSMHAIFHMARRKISALLGDFHFLCADFFFDFGPGATVSLPRAKANAPNKFSNPKLTVTQNCLDIAVAALCRNSAWVDYQVARNGQDPRDWFRLVPGNKVVTVPKNAKTERTIAIEPDMNMFVQKGIGGMIRRRLHRVGVHLDDQTPNQRLAQDGSLTGSLSTIDLSSASDSVSLSLVELLLPPDWCDAIKASRSPRGVLPDGKLITYRKVSSMGNGFTFELESLIFWALCSSAIYYSGTKDLRIGVYGDDIVVPTDASKLCLDVLDLAGFTPNKKKTFVHGPFRESCGKHYLSGEDVTPFYVKDRIETTDRLYWFLNSLSVWSGLPYQYQFRDDRVQPIWEESLLKIPPSQRCFGPLFLGGSMSTVCIGVPFDQALPSKSPYGWEGYTFSGRVKISYSNVHDSIGCLIAFLDRFGRSDLRTRREFSRLQGRTVWRIKKLHTPQWQEVGPWLTTRAR